jgi:hypothetical protein
MYNLKTETSANNFSHVHTTTDYSLFKAIEGNRNKNLVHINNLKKSMSTNYLFTVIIVNENYEIIDGHHRFEVIKELKLPLNYIICIGYGLNEVHILNQNSKTWNADDYLNGYCNLGNENYIKYREFKNKYAIGHNECMTILSGGNAKDNIKTFYSGNFKIKDYKIACDKIDTILLISPYYSGVRRRSFIYAMLQLLKNPNFDFSEFLQKLKYQSSALIDCTNTTHYVALIEEIYNFRRRDKINLRY